MKYPAFVRSLPRDHFARGRTRIDKPYHPNFSTVDHTLPEPDKDAAHVQACRDAGGFPVLNIPAAYRRRA